MLAKFGDLTKIECRRHASYSYSNQSGRAGYERSARPRQRAAAGR